MLKYVDNVTYVLQNAWIDTFLILIMFGMTLNLNIKYSQNDITISAGISAVSRWLQFGILL